MSQFTARVGDRLTAETWYAACRVSAGTYVPGGTLTITSANYTNIGFTAVTHYKVFDSSRLEIGMHVSSWCNGAVPTNVQFGVATTGGDIDLVHQVHSVTGSHRMCHGFEIIRGMALGTRTFTPRWRRTTGTGTPTMDTSDTMMFYVREILE